LCFVIKTVATKVFAIAGRDRRAIGSKSLISFRQALTLIIERQNLSSTTKQKINFGMGVTGINAYTSAILSRYM